MSRGESEAEAEAEPGAGPGSSAAFEAHARRLLTLLGRLTGLESTYLTSIDWERDTQRILFSRNVGDLEIPEGLTVGWSETICRRALAGEPAFTADVPSVYPDNDGARELGLRTYVTVPIEGEDGSTWGTLCGVSRRQVETSEDARQAMGILADMVAGMLRHEGDRRRLAELNDRLQDANTALSEHQEAMAGEVRERQHAEEEARRERDFLGVVLASIREGYVYTVDGEIVDVNEPLCRLTGFSRTELVGQHRPFPFWPPDETARLTDAAAAVLAGVGGDLELTFLHRDGTPLPVAITARPAVAPDGASAGFITIITDLTAVKRRESQLLDIASRDGLTGLYNRRAIDQQFALLEPDDAVVIIDLDHFKAVNDTHGHAAGDRLLTSLAELITATLREDDWAGRLGGEEFILVARRGGIGGAATLVHRLRDHWDDTHPPTTFSAGIAAHTASTEPRQTLARADEAMYRAKRAGRNRTEVFTPVALPTVP
jgi:diguanylate cyclase (GGDEF)-like protein/PAS domain S-box-containing protein